MHTDVQAYTDALTAAEGAWQTLCQSGDPLVAYIATHTPDDQRNYAERVLRALPDDPRTVTPAQLREIGMAQDIPSSALEEFIQNAGNAGVFGTPIPAGQAERDALKQWAREVGGSYVTDAHIAQLMQRVDAVVAAETPVL